jgi:uncharacterized protein DUF4160
MPTILTEKGFRFFFYSNENGEPMHVHVEKGDAEGKVWLVPIVKVAYMIGFTTNEERQIMQIIAAKIVILKQKWNEHFA